MVLFNKCCCFFRLTTGTCCTSFKKIIVSHIINHRNYDELENKKITNDEIDFQLRIGGMILGWIGAIESLFVVILTTIGLTHVPQIMDHLRNETQRPIMDSLNDTQVSIFRRHRGEMTLVDEMFIERGTQLNLNHMQQHTHSHDVMFTLH
jgi:hypothetical protein